MNPLLALQPRRGSREELALLRERLSSMGFRPDASRVATPPPAPFVPPTIGPRREGLPYAPERAPARGISVDFGDGRGERALNMDMIEGVASLSSAPARGVAAAAKAALPRLSALHNITEEKLARSLDLGGLPVPSIAVVPEQVPFTDFGPITLIGKQSLGDPATSRVYSADAYTTRVPDRTWPKLTKKQADEFWKETTGSFGNRSADDAFRALQDNDLDRAVSLSFMSPDIVANFVRDVRGWDPADVERIRRGSPGDYNKVADDDTPLVGVLGPKFHRYAQDFFAPLMQNPQVKVGRELRDWNLDNVVEAMSGRGRLTEGRFGWAPTSGEIRAAHADVFRGLEPMRRRAATDVRFDNDAYLSATGDLLRTVKEAAWSLPERAPENNPLFVDNPLGESARERILRALGNVGDLERNLADEGLEDVPPSVLESLEVALDNFKRAPVKYFEAKPQRGVRFDEFAGAVVPKNTDASLIERLRNAGLQVEPYWRGPFGEDATRSPIVANLRRLLNEQGGNTLFSLGALGAGLGAATPSRSRQDNR